MNLFNQVIQSIRWSSVNVVASTLIQFVQISILARILSPVEFGLVALVMLVINFVQPIVDLGLSAAIIQKQQVTHRQLSTLYWLNILLGIIAFLLLFLLAPAISDFYQEPELIPLTRWTGLVFLIIPWGAQYRALLTARLAFDLLAKMTIFSLVVAFGIAVYLAIQGWGAQALVISFLVREAIMAISLIITGRKIHQPKFVIDLLSVKSLLSFGGFKTGEAIVNFLSANLDKVLIGKLMGTYELGLYNLAWNLVLLPLRKINPIISRVAFPVFSKIKNQRDQIQEYYTQGLLLLMGINIPILLGLMVVSEDFILVFYGEQWLSLTGVIAILSVVGLLKCFASPGGSLLLAYGRADIGFYWNLIWALFTYGMIYMTIQLFFSLEAIAWTQLLAGCLIGWIWHLIIIKVTHVNYRKMLYQIGRLLLLVCLPMIFMLGLVSRIPIEDPVLRLSLKVGTGMLVYGSLLFLFFQDYLLSFYRSIKE